MGSIAFFGGVKKLLLLVYLWAKIYIVLMKYELFVPKLMDKI
jgi:hypothetical protein